MLIDMYGRIWNLDAHLWIIFLELYLDLITSWICRQFIGSKFDNRTSLFYVCIPIIHIPRFYFAYHRLTFYIMVLCIFYSYLYFYLYFSPWTHLFCMHFLCLYIIFLMFFGKARHYYVCDILLETLHKQDIQ